MNIIGKLPSGSFAVYFNGDISIVPDDIDNYHRREIMKIEESGVEVPNISDLPWGSYPDKAPVATPGIYAIADIFLDDGAIISVTTSAQISAVFYIDVGTYWVFFAETQPNTNYIPLCYNHNHTVFVDEKTEDFFVVSALSDGTPSDPASLSVEVKRVQ